MKANELRLGNWVNTCIPEKSIMIPDLEAQVQGITIFNDIEFNHTPQQQGFTMSRNHVSGIPLSEQRIASAGFIKMNSEWHMGGSNWYLKYNKDHDQYSLWHTHTKWGVAIKMQYIHKLQNIWYELHGIELEFNREELERTLS